MLIGGQNLIQPPSKCLQSPDPASQCTPPPSRPHYPLRPPVHGNLLLIHEIAAGKNFLYGPH